MTSQVLDGSYIDPTAGQVDFRLLNHILPAFADRPIASIRPTEVQAWVRSRSVPEAVGDADCPVIFELAGDRVVRCRFGRLPEVESGCN